FRYPDSRLFRRRIILTMPCHDFAFSFAAAASSNVCLCLLAKAASDWAIIFSAGPGSPLTFSESLDEIYAAMRESQLLVFSSFLFSSLSRTSQMSLGRILFTGEVELPVAFLA